MIDFKIQNLTIKGIKSYGNNSPGDISFSEGRNIIVGENGSGKSTILQSLIFILTGKIPSSIEKQEEFLQNNINTGEISLKFTLNGDDGYIYRKIKRRGQDDCYLEFRNRVVKDVTNVKKEILELLGINEDLLYSSIYAEQGQIEKIVSLKGKDAKKLFNELLGLDNYIKSAGNVKTIVKKYENKIGLVTERIDSYSEDVKQLPEKESTLSVEKKDLENKENELEKIIRDVREKEAPFIATKKLKEDLEDLEIVKDREKENQNEIETILKAKFSKIKQEFSTTSEIDAELSKTKTEIKKQETKIKELEKRIQDNQTLKKDIDTLVEDKKKLERDYKRIKDKITQRESKLTEYPKVSEHASLEDKRKYLIEQETKITAENTELTKQQDDLNAIQTNLSTLNERFKNEQKTKMDLEKNSEKTLKLLLKEFGESWKKIFSANRTDLVSEKKKYEKLVEELKEQILKTQEKYNKNDSYLQIAKDKKIHFQEWKKDHCPECERIMDPSDIQSLITKYEEQIEQYISVKEKLGLENNSLSALFKENDSKCNDIQNIIIKFDLFDQYNSFKETLEELKKSTLNKEIEKLQKEYDKYNKAEMDEKYNANNKLLKIIPSNLDHVDTLKILSKEKLDKNDEMEKKINELSLKERDFDPDIEIALQKDMEVATNVQNDNFERKDDLNSIRQTIGNLISKRKKIGEIEKEYKEKGKNFNQKEWEKLETTYNSLLDGKKVIETTVKERKTKLLPQLEDEVKTLLKKKDDLKNFRKKKKYYETVKSYSESFRSVLNDIPRQLLISRKDGISFEATNRLRDIDPTGKIQALQLTDKYEFKAIMPDGEFPLYMLSGGERIACALAMRIAITKSLSGLNFLLLDEPTIHLDENKQTYLKDLLERSQLLDQLILVTHNKDFSTIANNLIEVEWDTDHSVIHQT